MQFRSVTVFHTHAHALIIIHTVPVLQISLHNGLNYCFHLSCNTSSGEDDDKKNLPWIEVNPFLPILGAGIWHKKLLWQCDRKKLPNFGKMAQTCHHLNFILSCICLGFVKLGLIRSQTTFAEWLYVCLCYSIVPYTKGSAATCSHGGWPLSSICFDTVLDWSVDLCSM